MCALTDLLAQHSVEILENTGPRISMPLPGLLVRETAMREKQSRSALVW
jgi:hypothetical protein